MKRKLGSWVGGITGAILFAWSWFEWHFIRGAMAGADAALLASLRAADTGFQHLVWAALLGGVASVVYAVEVRIMLPPMSAPKEPPSTEV